MQYENSPLVGPYSQHNFDNTVLSNWVVDDSTTTSNPSTSANFDFVQDSGNFAISTFVNLGSNTSGLFGQYQVLFDNCDIGFAVGASTAPGFSLLWDGAHFEFRMVTSAGSAYLAPTLPLGNGLSSSGIQPNTWYYVAVVGSRSPSGLQTLDDYIIPAGKAFDSADQIGPYQNHTSVQLSAATYSSTATLNLTIANAAIHNVHLLGGMANETIFNTNFGSSNEAADVLALYSFGTNFSDEANANDNYQPTTASAVFRPADPDIGIATATPVSGDTYVLTVSGGQDQVWRGSSVVSSSDSLIRQFSISGSGAISTMSFGADTNDSYFATLPTINLVIDYSGGDPIPSGGLIFNGGTSGQLWLENTSQPFVSEEISSTSFGSGSLLISEPGQADTISFAGTSNIIDQASTANLTWHVPQQLAGTTTLQTDNAAGAPGNIGAAGFALTSSSSGIPTFEFSNKSDVNVDGGPAGNIFDVNSVPSSLTINTGSGNDTVNVFATPSGSSTTIDAGGPNQTFNAGSSTTPLSQIVGTLLFNGVNTAMYFVDSDNSNTVAYTVTNSAVTSGTTSIGYRGTGTVNVSTGTSPLDTIGVESTSAPTTVTANPTVTGQPIHIGDVPHLLAGIASALSVGGDSSPITFDDSANNATAAIYMLSSSTLTDSSASGSITYTGASQTTLATGAQSGNSVTVRSTSSPATINVSGSSAQVNVGDLNDPLSGLAGALQVNGSSDNTASISVTDIGNTANESVGNTYSVYSNNITSDNNANNAVVASVGFSNMATVSLSTSNGADTVYINSTPPNLSVTTGDDANDSVYVWATNANSNTTITAGGSNPYFSVGTGDLTAIQGAVTITNTSSGGFLGITNTSTTAGTFTFSSVSNGASQGDALLYTRPSFTGGLITYIGVQSVMMNDAAYSTSGNTFNLGTPDPTNPVRMNLPAGITMTLVLSGTNTVNIDTTGTGTLVVDEESTAVNDTFYIDGLGGGPSGGQSTFNLGADSYDKMNIGYFDRNLSQFASGNYITVNGGSYSVTLDGGEGSTTEYDTVVNVYDSNSASDNPQFSSTTGTFTVNGVTVASLNNIVATNYHLNPSS